jgi:short-subunit dehydrogenase
MNNRREQWAVVTGASQGIGLALARCFAQDGIHLVLVARSKERLLELASTWPRDHQVKILPIALDLTAPRAPDLLHEQVSAAGIRASFLVNNAGSGLFGRYQETALEREHEMLQLNCLALTRLTKLFLKDMLEEGHGRILNLASTASFQPGPYQAVYFATKAYVLSFSEAIAEDLANTGVTVTAWCPGLTASGFIERAGMASSRFAQRARIGSAEQVAAVGYRAMLKGQRVVVPGLLNCLSAQAPRFAPRRAVTSIVSAMMKPAAS